MTDSMDERYVGFREHTAAKEELNERIAQVELKQARMDASLMHLPEKVDKLGERIDRASALMERKAAADWTPPTSIEQASLALHHAAEAFQGPGRVRRALSLLEWIAVAGIAAGGLAVAAQFGILRIGG